jgi:hypothetical protein
MSAPPFSCLIIGVGGISFLVTEAKHFRGHSIHFHLPNLLYAVFYYGLYAHVS